MNQGEDLTQMITFARIDRENRYRDMLLDFIDAYAQRLATRHHPPVGADDWLSRRSLKEALLHGLGVDLLTERSPIAAKVVGTVELADYTIRKIVYESLPAFPVTAHLYVPRTASFPAPAVLYSPGHWYENSKLEPDIQICCGNLARLGFVVLVYDPIGQGERMTDWLDHGHLEPLLVGLSQEGLMVWESIRAIDYLSSLHEVDPHRIGMTGASGGGLNTVFTCAVEERIKVSVPVCYVTTFYQSMASERDRNWEDGVDLCNQVPGVMAIAEMWDICGLFAPKPLCLVAATRDWMFPIEGTRSISGHLRHLYEMLGTEDKFRLVEVDAEHGYNQDMREAAYGWLAYWLQGTGDMRPISEARGELLAMPYHPSLTYIAPPDIADLPVLRERSASPKPSEGLCLPLGNETALANSVTALARSLAGKVHRDLVMPKDADGASDFRVLVSNAIRDSLGPFPPGALVQDRIYSQFIHNGVFAERVVFESEPGIHIPSMFLAPADYKTYSPVAIYVDEWGKDAGLSNGVIATLVKNGFAVFAVDVRGIGETFASDFEAATNALMTDRPLFGQRVYDVIRAIDCLWRRIYACPQIDKGRIACIGKGVGGLLALHAAILDERLCATVAWETPVSFEDLLTDRACFPASTFLFGVLRRYDLPDLMAAHSPRPLLLVNPVAGDRRFLDDDGIRRHLMAPRQVHTAAMSELAVMQTDKSQDPEQTAHQLVKWLRVRTMR